MTKRARSYTDVKETDVSLCPVQRPKSIVNSGFCASWGFALQCYMTYCIAVVRLRLQFLSRLQTTTHLMLYNFSYAIV